MFRDRTDFLALLWGLAFLASLLFCNRAVADLARQSDHIGVRSAAELDALWRQSRDTGPELLRRTREYEFYNSVIGIIPQEKSFLRTRKAIDVEVKALRKDVGRRVAGQWQVLVDTQANKLYVKKGLQLLWQADVSVGRGKTLKDKKTGRQWLFATPLGEFKILGRAKDPVWRRPDWSYVEQGLPVPPPDDPSRIVEGELGKYVLNLGDGYLMHGTKHEDLLGRPASHGCVRLGSADLERLYKEVPDGTKVYLY